MFHNLINFLFGCKDIEKQMKCKKKECTESVQ